MNEDELEHKGQGVSILLCALCDTNKQLRVNKTHHVLSAFFFINKKAI